MIENNHKTTLTIPRNRREVFFDLWRNYKMTLAKINLMTLVFALPAVIWLYLSFLTKGSLEYLIESDLIQAPIPEDLSQSIAILKMQVNNVTFAFLIPLVMVAAIGLSGSVHAIQKLVFAENIEVRSDFKTGIRKNWKQYLLLSLLLSLSLFFFVFVTGYYSFETDIIIKSISLAIATAQLVIVLMLSFVAFPYFNLYRARLMRGLWHCLALFFYHPGQAITMLLLATFPFVLLIMPVFWLQTITAIFLLTFIFSFDITLMILYSNHVFDQRINPGHYRDLINKGLATYDPNQIENHSSENDLYR